MAFIIIGAVLILAGLAGLFNGGFTPAAIVPLLICFLGGGGLIYLGLNRLKNPPLQKDPTPEPQDQVMSTSPPVGSFTFEPTGSRFECKFPIKGFTMRQQVLQKSKIGDPITLQIYEWEGKPAVAVMNARIGADLGVAKKGQSSKLVKLLKDFIVTGQIMKFTDFDVKDENYLGCEIQLNYYEKN